MSIGLDPNFADSYALLAFAQSTSGDAGQALVTMRKALAISPRNENYLFNVAGMYLANRQPDQAIAVLQSLRVTDNPELASRVAGTLAQARQFRQLSQESAGTGPGMVLLRKGNPEPSGDPTNTEPSAPVPVSAETKLRRLEIRPWLTR